MRCVCSCKKAHRACGDSTSWPLSDSPGQRQAILSVWKSKRTLLPSSPIPTIAIGSAGFIFLLKEFFALPKGSMLSTVSSSAVMIPDAIVSTHGAKTLKWNFYVAVPGSNCEHTVGDNCTGN